MFIIEVEDKRRFIAGIFKNEEKLNKAYKFMPNIVDESNLLDIKYKLITSPIKNYPFYILEENNTFSYLYFSEIELYIKNIKRIENMDEDASYCNIYLAIKDFITSNPYKEHMGILPHIHIDNNFLDYNSINILKQFY